MQLPTPVAAFARSSGYDVALTAILGPPAPITGPMPGSSDESGAPVVFFGDHQVTSCSYAEFAVLKSYERTHVLGHVVAAHLVI